LRHADPENAPDLSAFLIGCRRENFSLPMGQSSRKRWGLGNRGLPSQKMNKKNNFLKNMENPSAALRTK
jgi:hypothetical protein